MSREKKGVELTPEPVQVRIIVVEPPKPKAITIDLGGRTGKATAKKREGGDRHRIRAAQLRRQGLSRPQIAIRMAFEEGRSLPYNPRTVSRWLSAAATKKG